MSGFASANFVPLAQPPAMPAGLIPSPGACAYPYTYHEAAGQLLRVLHPFWQCRPLIEGTSAGSVAIWCDGTAALVRSDDGEQLRKAYLAIHVPGSDAGGRVTALVRALSTPEPFSIPLLEEKEAPAKKRASRARA